MQVLTPYRKSPNLPQGTEIPEAILHPARTSFPDRQPSSTWHLFPVSSSTVLLTLNQLAVMSQNGVELAEAVEHIAQHCRDPRLSASLQRIHHAVNSGSTFSRAIAIHGHHFPSTLPAMLAAAEATGEVPETLTQVCDRMRGEMEMRSTIVSAMIYPIILISASLVVMAALIVGVLPQFGKVFDSMGKTVPPSTEMLLSLGEFCKSNALILFPAAAAIAAALFMIRQSHFVRGPIGRFLLYGPLIRDAYRPLAAGRTFRTIAAMVRGGVPLLQAIRLTRQTTTDVSWQSLLDRIEDNLIDGIAASEAMKKVDFLPAEATQMMATGERTGRIAEVLEDIGVFYEQEGGRRVKRLVIALEPVIILVMGVIVAGVVMSVMLPLLDVSTVGS